MSNISTPKIRPFQPAPPDRYCRLFEPIDQPFDLNVMTDLGRSMSAEESPIPKPMRVGTPPAGYTYFGQFIDHDITRDDTYLLAASSDLRDIVNKGGARLDLNQLYGDGPASFCDGHLYDGASFRLGKTRLPNGSPFDLWMKDDQPQAADNRTPSNAILRQLCVMFMMLHNLAVEDLQKKQPSLGTFELFTQARNRVRWQYQWLVREDFLYHVCGYNVFKEVVVEGRTLIDWDTECFSVPVEFSQAAFRFGHSMVRPSYTLRDDTVPVSLRDLFSGANPKGPLDPEMAVDWQKFLEVGRVAVENAMNIDSAIAPFLLGLPKDHVSHFKVSEPASLPPELPVRTLQRGAITRLPTGETVAEKLGRKIPLREEQLPKGTPDPWPYLDKLGLSGRTPLWYYILLEAEIEMTGVTLGTIGSRIVAEVIEGALRADPTSYLVNTPKGWRPEPWKDSTGKEISIEYIKDVAIVVGLSRDDAEPGD